MPKLFSGLEWITEHVFPTIYSVWAAIIGVTISVIMAEGHSIKDAIARVVCGLFFSLTLTDPIIDRFGLNPAIYGDAISGLLALLGFQLVKAINRVQWDHFMEFAKLILLRK